MSAKRKKGKGRGKSRRISLKSGFLLLAFLAVWGFVSEWFVHHPRAWIDAQPTVVAAPLLWFGNPLADITDALDLTGYDTVCEYDTEAPANSVLFAGAPVRISAPAPDDIRIIDRGEFKIGWSDTLRHPVWCAYHVVRAAPFSSETAAHRPAFSKDRALPRSPDPKEYTHSGYDRGHMAPNYAIATRYGVEMQKRTFLTSNITPQSESLNRGVWREVEHRIADLWTARYGEIWVIVGCISRLSHRETIGETSIDVPRQFYQIVIAQEGMDVRALALLFDQSTPYRAWPARHLVTIDEIEKLSGLDFNSEMPSFMQDQLEADLPNRLWPVRPLDVLSQLSFRFNP